MTLGREVQLRYADLTRDRNDRALAYVVTVDRLGPKLRLNAEMVKRGGARVSTDHDTADANAPLVAPEQVPHPEKTGLWKELNWAAVDASRLPDSFRASGWFTRQPPAIKDMTRPASPVTSSWNALCWCSRSGCTPPHCVSYRAERPSLPAVRCAPFKWR